MSREDLIPNAAAQNGWNCFDVAAGIDRDFIVEEALTDDEGKRSYYRLLLAPEIMNAAVLTVVHELSQEEDILEELLDESYEEEKLRRREQTFRLLGITKGMPKEEASEIAKGHCDYLDAQRQMKNKKGSLNWPRFALPRAMCVDKYGAFNKTLKDTVVDFLGADEALKNARHTFESLQDDPSKEAERHHAQQNHQEAIRAHEKAHKKFRDLCENNKVYEGYIRQYYGKNGWFVFQPQIGGTSMVDVVAAIMQINFQIFQEEDFTNPYRKTLEKTKPVRKIYYNGFNHFMAYRPGWSEPSPDDKMITESTKSGNMGDLLEFLRSHQNMARKDPIHGGTALHWAAHYGQISMLRELYIAGAPLEEKDGTRGRTALGYAAKRYSEVSGNDSQGLATCIEFLWQQCGADPNIKDNNGKTPHDYCPDLFDGDEKHRKKEQGVYQSLLPIRERSQSPGILFQQEYSEANSNLGITLTSGQQYILPGFDIHTELRNVEHAFRRSCQQYKERLTFGKLIKALEENKDQHNPRAYVESILESIFNRNLTESLKESLLQFQEKIIVAIISEIGDENKKNMRSYLTTQGGKVQKRLIKEYLTKASALIVTSKMNLKSIVDEHLESEGAQTPQTITKQLSNSDKMYRHNKPNKEIDTEIKTIEKKLSARDAMPALPPSSDTTNFVCASLSFVVKKQDQSHETITLPIALKQSVFSINDTRRDRFIGEKTNSEGSLYLQDLIFNRTIKKTNPSLKAAKAESCSHSEQAVFYYLYDGDVQYHLVKRLLSQAPLQASNPDAKKEDQIFYSSIEAIEAISLDMHSTRMMCTNCQQAGRAFLADTMGFRKHLIETLNRRSKLPEKHPGFLPFFKQKNSSETQLFCRVTADIPHGDCKNPSLISDPNEKPTTLDDPSRPFILDTRKLPVSDGAGRAHKYSIATSGGSNVPNEYPLAYLQLVMPTLERASLIITEFLARRTFKKQMTRKAVSKPTLRVAGRLFGRPFWKQIMDIRHPPQTPTKPPRIKRSPT